MEYYLEKQITDFIVNSPSMSTTITLFVHDYEEIEFCQSKQHPVSYEVNILEQTEIFKLSK